MEDDEAGVPKLSKMRTDKGGEVDFKTKSGTAWSHSFLNQKPWHPLSYPNQRRKWIAEQSHAVRQRRAEELAREQAQEQDFLRQTSLLSAKEKEKVDMMQAVSFMYIRPPGYNAESAKAAEIVEEKKKIGESDTTAAATASSSAPQHTATMKDEKKKPRPKDVFGRTLPTEEEFAALKNAPRLETGVAGRAKPFAVEIRNVKCVRCGNFGHQSGDRECPLKDAIMPNEESRLQRIDPLTKINAQTDPSEPLNWELKQKPGMSPPRGGFQPDDPNQQIVAEDIFDEYGGFLSRGVVPELLTNFSSKKHKKKSKRKSKRKKRDLEGSSDSDDQRSPKSKSRSSHKKHKPSRRDHEGSSADSDDQGSSKSKSKSKQRKHRGSHEDDECSSDSDIGQRRSNSNSKSRCKYEKKARHIDHDEDSNETSDSDSDRYRYRRSRKEDNRKHKKGKRYLSCSSVSEESENKRFFSKSRYDRLHDVEQLDFSKHGNGGSPRRRESSNLYDDSKKDRYDSSSRRRESRKLYDDSKKDRNDSSSRHRQSRKLYGDSNRDGSSPRLRETRKMYDDVSSDDERKSNREGKRNRYHKAAKNDSEFSSSEISESERKSSKKSTTHKSDKTHRKRLRD